ncbi:MULTISPECIES: low molecular weight protein-tyrosine-phosphatase [Leptospira]|uniref:protein-tyrosine-phosphatase n=2 Tax=Leptospira kirschneri TaxID=29507 RepID=A0A1T1DMN7_9LEPT|nr:MULTISPECIES: low molecular weight protein-tyrosine-phosphatase [Leptospira]EJO67796.1 low molecular weight phosphotyrosine protein phosphatase [Leptospira kirschneri serovar Grippotyphosa str. RM52]EKP07035.1 low molecular weight phosphotyrosine protein phosphatase [Leptospira kirschneri str. 2008720114]EKQ85498.1 low molecular weight phosphotyrosine protein phosphatase [Leptospira kirschneri serovar Grippotyphosa str. Moskva]EKR09401.1 low molecular weight phosphotyrosine protein phosphata
MVEDQSEINLPFEKQNPKGKNLIRVLFVCLGNICRSPAAEGAFLDLIQKRNLESSFLVDSCGTSRYHIGELPDPRTRQVARKKGIELTHRARQFRREDFKEFDYILTMDKSNQKDVLSLASSDEERKKVQLFRFFQKDSKKDSEVPDPYYGTLKDFEEVQNIVSDAAEDFLEFLLSRKLDLKT